MKWIKADNPNQYFVKEAAKKWVEYHDGTIFAEFEEKKNIYNTPIAIEPYVILQRTDGLYVRLNNNKAYYGDGMDHMNFLCNGRMEN